MFLRRAVVLCWLLLALVLAPALGLVHGVLHGGARLPSTAFSHASSGMAQTHLHQVQHVHQGVVDHLFGAHGLADCRLYDQLAHSDMAPGIAMLVLPHVPIGFAVRHQAGEAMARFVALFDARGPPSRT